MMDKCTLKQEIFLEALPRMLGNYRSLCHVNRKEKQETIKKIWMQSLSNMIYGSRTLMLNRTTPAILG
jgi:hypothetical protein